MRILIACEFSGVVREAFAAKGHDAWSCDLRQTEIPSKKHIVGNVLKILTDGWDILIAHPPCTHLSVSGARWFSKKVKRQKRALDFFVALLNAKVHSICVENPVSISSTRVVPPSQKIQPWMFGHEASKTTCLWLKNLPPLRPTKIVGKGEFRITKDGRKHLPSWMDLPPSVKDRGKERSRTFQGIADAMADQWGLNKHTTGFGIYCDYSVKE